MLYENELNSVQEKIKNIGNGLVTANKFILKALEDCEHDKFDEAKSNIKNISSKTNEIDNEIIKILALYSPEARDLRQVVSYLKITNELDRAITNTRSFIKGFVDVCSQTDVKIVQEYAIPMQKSTVKAVKLSISMLDMDCEDELRETFNDVIVEESKTDDLYEIVEKSLLKEAEASDEFEKFHNMLKALRKSEKIADRAISIAQLILYIKIGGNFQS